MLVVIGPGKLQYSRVKELALAEAERKEQLQASNSSESAFVGRESKYYKYCKK